MTDGAEFDEVVLFQDDFGVLVRGPSEAVSRVVDRLLEGTSIERRSSSRVQVSEAAAVAATGAQIAAAQGEYVRLTSDSLAKVRQFGAQHDKAGAMRAYVRGDGGKMAGQLTFNPVRLNPEQALALQTAAVSMALRTAIADVQKAVERVEGKVETIQQHLQSRLTGDVVGTFRHLERVAAATNARGRLLEADWDSVAAGRSQIYRDLETMRTTVLNQARTLAETDGLPKRAELIEQMHDEPGSLRDILDLILVAEQSLQLYEYLRLQQVRRGDPDQVANAADEARASLQEQQRLDEQLVAAIASAVDKARVVDPLEIHHLFARKGLDVNSRRLHQAVSDFATDSRLQEIPTLDERSAPTLADARAELRARAVDTTRTARALGTAAAAGGSDALRRGGRRISKSALGRVRRTMKDEEA